MTELPTICKDDTGNTAWIELHAAVGQKIDWSEALDLAQSQVTLGKKIFWELNLGLSAPQFPIDDPVCFQELSLALKHFTDAVYPRFEKDTLGASLYKGPLDLSSRFSWSDRQRENFSTWKKETGLDSPSHFYLDTYAAYFQMLSHKLPDDLAVFILFDATGLPRVEVMELCSKERFQHFELAVKGVSSPFWCYGWEEKNSTLGWIGEGGAPTLSFEPKIGVMIPEKCDSKEFEELLTLLDLWETPYRVVSETFFTEEWDGLEVVIAGAISLRGKRMVMGFCASGGLAVYTKEPHRLVREMSLEEFRGRGIRTPDLLVPNQPR